MVCWLLCAGALMSCGPSDNGAGAGPQAEAGLPAPSTPAGEPATADSDGPLAGSEWRLVEFRSMDDAIGTIRPDDPSLYTMRLDGDGSVSMALDCNRATGTWSAEPSGDGSSGRFEFGPLAATRALCPPPRLDERITADAEFVRSYLLKEGRLYLALMADAGIYAWEPHDPEGPGKPGVPVEEGSPAEPRN